MLLPNWLQRLAKRWSLCGDNLRQARVSGFRVRPFLEGLEERVLPAPAVIVVGGAISEQTSISVGGKNDTKSASVDAASLNFPPSDGLYVSKEAISEVDIANKSGDLDYGAKSTVDIDSGNNHDASVLVFNHEPQGFSTTGASVTFSSSASLTTQELEMGIQPDVGAGLYQGDPVNLTVTYGSRNYFGNKFSVNPTTVSSLLSVNEKTLSYNPAG